MRPGARAALTGAITAVFVVAVIGGGAWWYLRSTGALSKVDKPDSVVVVMAAPGEDGTVIAQGVAVLHSASGVWEFVDPTTQAAVPGTSYNTLADAYPFGGAAAVASALAATRRMGKVGWIDMPYATWQSTLGDSGLEVSVPAPMNVFDGRQLTTFAEGTQTVRAQGLAALLNGAGYLDKNERLQLLESVWARTLAVWGTLGASATPGIQTNLSQSALERIRSALPRQ